MHGPRSHSELQTASTDTQSSREKDARCAVALLSASGIDLPQLLRTMRTAETPAPEAGAALPLHRRAGTVQRTGAMPSAATSQTVAAQAFVLIAQPVVRRAPMAHRVYCLTAVVRVWRREPILADRVTPRHAAELGQCQRLAFSSLCDGAAAPRVRGRLASRFGVCSPLGWPGTDCCATAPQ